MWKLVIQQEYNSMEFEFHSVVEAAVFIGNFCDVTSYPGVTEYTLTKKGEENDNN